MGADIFRVDMVEDDAEVREGLVDLIETMEGFQCGVVVDSMEAYLWETRKENRAGVVLMDIGLPGMSGIDGTRLLKEKHPDLKVVMITINQDSAKIFEALRAGAGGYIHKSATFAEIAGFLQLVRDGGAPMSPQIATQIVAYFHPNAAPVRKSLLSDREREVVTAIVDGLSYKLVGARLNISMGTVCSHITNIYKKLQVNSKAELIKMSYDDNI